MTGDEGRGKRPPPGGRGRDGLDHLEHGPACPLELLHPERC